MMAETSKNFSKNNFFNTKIRLTGLLIVILGLVAGVFMVQRVQDIRRKAAVPDGQANVYIDPETGSYSVGDSIQAKVFFNNANIAINGVAVRLTYAFSGATPEVTVSSIDINPTILTSGEWNCPTKNWNLEGNSVVIDMACVNNSAFGFISSGDTLLATINMNIENEPGEGSFTLRFDPNNSLMTEKTTGEDILSIPTSTATYTIGQSSAPKLYFFPSEIDATINSTNLVYDIYLDTAGYEVNGAVFEVNFDTDVIKVVDIVEAGTLRLVIDKSVEGGTAYLAVILADETKPFVGVAKAATVVFDTFSTETTTFFTFDKNTQIHAKGITSNILDKAIKGTIHIGLPSTPTPTPTPTIAPSISPTPTPYLIVTTDAFIDGEEGDPYRNFFYGEARNYSYDPELSLTATNLPPGLSVPPELCGTSFPHGPGNIKRIHCALDGLPTTPGDFDVLVTVSDDRGSSESKLVPIKIIPIPTIPTTDCAPGYLPGDGNGDCTVDGIDYGIWFVHYNQNVTGWAADGDYDLSGFVDGLDYAIWFINFGKTVTPP